LVLDFKLSPCSVCFLLGNSPASEFYMPTFRNTLSVPSSFYTYLPMKMEQSVLKHRRIKFRRRGFTQKKTYNIFWYILFYNKQLLCSISFTYRNDFIGRQTTQVWGVSLWRWSNAKTCRRKYMYVCSLHALYVQVVGFVIISSIICCLEWTISKQTEKSQIIHLPAFTCW
jgi:hypothetical protein